MLEKLAQQFRTHVRGLDFWALRLVDERSQSLAVRQDILRPVTNYRSTGAMVTIADSGGIGYGATSNLTSAGLASALEEARSLARATAAYGLVSLQQLPRPTSTAVYETPAEKPWDSTTLADKVSLLHDLSRRLHSDERIVDWQAKLNHNHTEVLLVTAEGAHLHQSFSYLEPGMYATANASANTQTRSYGNGDLACQGGLEQLTRLGFEDQAERVAAEALELVAAPDCPTGVMDILLMPRQMVLQIHESIGHPLELDRILGDERNYAGTSFVTLDMFGSYRYGADLLNITFNPDCPQQLASYGFDDEGSAARRSYIIRNGILQRPLGGATSQARTRINGVANARASGWNRPPIDRMANLNLEPGTSSLEEMVASVENGVLMDTNRSWSIDDSRNKFQFGCEYAREIHEGRLGRVLKNPNYRGISATFWRGLKMVGNDQTLEISGTPFCGKGEPNQMIHVGHASPACAFSAVEVFGGA